MSSGVLFSGLLTPNANTTTGQVPASKVMTVDIFVINNGTSPALVKIFADSSASPDDSKLIAKKVTLNPNGTIQITGRIVGAGQRITIYAGGSGVAANISGFEEAA